MHEMSIAMGLCRQLDELAAEHRARSIGRVVLEVGALSNVVPDLLREALEALRQEMPLVAECVFEIRDVPLVVHCHDCEKEHRLREFRFWCPQCESPRVQVVSGEELLLRDVELEVPDTKPDETQKESAR